MAERPILFSGPLVRAILDERKTETRRLVTKSTSRMVAETRATWDRLDWKVATINRSGLESGLLVRDPDTRYHGVAAKVRVGDTLWVRETFGVVPESLGKPFDPKTGEGCRVLYRATDGDPDPDGWENWKWTPSIYMRPWASRITLAVTEVRAERLHEITDEGAKAEGITVDEDQVMESFAAGLPSGHYRSAFARLWDEINGKRPGARWDDNPWVWVIKFEVLGTSGAAGKRPEGGE